MRIPKYIDELLESRAKAAERFIHADIQIAEWLDKNNIDVGPDDINTGVCSLCEPRSSIANIRDCIRKAGEPDEG